MSAKNSKRFAKTEYNVARKTFFLLFNVVASLLLLTSCGDKADTISVDSEAAANAAQAMLTSGASGDSADGKALFAACVACHGEGAEGNQAMNAPNLLMQDAWYLKAQMMKFRNGQRGNNRDVYGMQMAAIAKTLADEAAVNSVIAYIDSLRDKPAETTIKGDIAIGRDYYTNVCGSCHGPAAEGYETFNAPALAGVDDWYLLRQFENFKNGVRGTHEDDKYGKQMAMMAVALPDREIAEHVTAYIQSLAK